MKRSTLVRTVGRCPPISSRLGSGLLGVQAHAAHYRLDEVVTVDQFVSAIDVGIAAEREIVTVVGGPANIEGGETGPGRGDGPRGGRTRARFPPPSANRGGMAALEVDGGEGTVDLDLGQGS